MELDQAYYTVNLYSLDKETVPNGCEDYCIHKVSYTESSEDESNEFFGLMFNTPEEAKERMKEIYYRLRFEKLSADSRRKEDTTYWYVRYDQDTQRLAYDVTSNVNGLIGFGDKQHLKDAVQEIGEVNVAKYILGLKDTVLYVRTPL